MQEYNIVQSSESQGVVEYLDYKEAAELLHISEDSFGKLLRTKPNIKEKYVTKMIHNGRKRYVISKEGALVLSTVKDSGRNNFELKGGFSDSKQQLAEQAISTAELLKDPIIQYRIKQIEQQKQIDELNNKVTGLYMDREQASQNLLALPVSPDKPKELTLRGMLRQRINTYAGAKNVPYAECNVRLYKELYYRYSFNASAIAKHRKITQIDAIEQEGMLKEAFDLACELFKLP